MPRYCFTDLAKYAGKDIIVHVVIPELFYDYTVIGELKFIDSSINHVIVGKCIVEIARIMYLKEVVK